MSIPGNSKLSERLAVLAKITPIAITTAASQAISATFASVATTTGNGYNRLLAVFQIGANTLTGTVTYKVLAGTASSGGGTLYTIASGTSTNSAKEFLIDLNQAVTGTTYATAPYIGLELTATSATVGAGVLLGGDAKYEPASTDNITSSTVGTGV